MMKHLAARCWELAKRPRLKQALVLIILLATIVLFVHFFLVHPEYFRSLRHTNPGWVALVLALNVPLLLALVYVYDAVLHLCGKALAWKETFMLTSYSSIINFFGPLQSGPGVRAVYLKTRHQVRIRDYTLGTLIYYGLFACISALFLLVGTRPWWQTTVVFLAVAGGSGFVIYLFRRRSRKSDSQFRLRPRPLIELIVATFMQVLLVSLIYFVELHAINRHISYGQAVAYAGAANFSLFVSLTPGAIGFRESFLYFSERLHHVSTANILAANLIDRSAYVIFLLLLFLLMLGLHARDRLRVFKPSVDPAP